MNASEPDRFRFDSLLQLLWKWIKRFGSAMMAAAVRYHDTPTKQPEPKAGKPKSLAERRKVRRQNSSGFDRRTQ